MNNKKKMKYMNATQSAIYQMRNQTLLYYNLTSI